MAQISSTVAAAVDSPYYDRSSSSSNNNNKEVVPLTCWRDASRAAERTNTNNVTYHSNDNNKPHATIKSDGGTSG